MKRSSIIIIDVCGAGIVAACALGFVWMLLLRDDVTKQEIDVLRGEIRSMRDDLSRLHGELDAQRAEVDQRRKDLALEGKLPNRTPVEQDLQAVYDVAKAHDIQVTGVTPLASRSYPGLLEQRYALETLGRMPSFTRFFKAIEDADLWVDIGYLKMESRPPGPTDADKRQKAVLTLSLFSAADADESDEADNGSG